MNVVRRTAKCRGAVLVEFAFISPVLAFVCLSIIDYSRLFYAYTTLADCARNGALYASYASSTPDASCAWLSNLSSASAAAQSDATNLKDSPVVVQSTVQGKDAFGNNYVEITVTYDFITIMKYPGIPRPVSLKRTSRMLVTPP